MLWAGYCAWGTEGYFGVLDDGARWAVVVLGDSVSTVPSYHTIIIIHSLLTSHRILRCDSSSILNDRSVIRQTPSTNLCMAGCLVASGWWLVFFPRIGTSGPFLAHRGLGWLGLGMATTYASHDGSLILPLASSSMFYVFAYVLSFFPLHYCMLHGCYYWHSRCY